MEALAADFSARLTPNVVITDGAAPLWIACGGEVRSKTPFAAAVRSVNGAGDAFAAGTIHGLGDGATLFDAVAIGLAAAALTVEAEATLPARLTAAAIAARLAEATRSTPA